jgi:membrane complex biogenesis BtpA family protein
VLFLLPDRPMLDLPNPALIGVIHLPPLPGSPRHTLPKQEIIARALADARTLEKASFDACILENFGDAPFLPLDVPPSAVALMAVVADRIQGETGLRLGINVLRNDARAALGIAAAVEAGFIRVNVHAGVAATDQGIVEGRAAETLRLRKELGRRIAILADVHVKHATPISEPDIGQAARDTAYRGLADGLIVTGRATGEPADPKDLQKVREAVPDRRVFVGSGATSQTVSSILTQASGVIVGSGIKKQHDPSRPVDLALAEEFAGAARGGAAS